MAPITPFMTERVWQDLFVASSEHSQGPATPVPDSVHLASWPQVEETSIDEGLESSMALTQRLVELGRSARSEAGIKIRQPLSRALISQSSLDKLTAELIEEITAELNIDTLESFSSDGDLVTYGVKGNFRSLGRRFGKKTAEVAALIAAADPAQVASAIHDRGEFTLDYDGGTIITADDVLISERPKQGWSVVGDQRETIALDVELTSDLLKAGWVREVVRGIQELRKNSGLDVSDRIHVSWTGQGDAAEALQESEDYVAGEVLATQITRSDKGGADWTEDKDLGISYWLTRA
jgi:isoleucyl-tRNA synthetase